MNTVWNKIALLLSLIGESVAILFVPVLAQDNPLPEFGLPEFGQPLWWLVHACLCLIFSYNVKGVLPSQFSTLPVSQFSGIFAIVFFIPVVGMLGFLLACVPAFHKPIGREKVLIIESPEPDLPFKAEDEGRKPVTLGSLREVLRFSQNVEERVNAVLSIRYIDTAQAVSILRLALKDKVDDVRLLAYAIIDQKESQIRVDIRKIRQTMESSQWQQPEVFVKQLASRYWQLVELGLLQGSLEQAAAIDAVKYARDVLIRQPDLDMYLLLARYHQHNNEPKKAREYLEKMIEHGLLEKHLYEEFAELAIADKDFSQLEHFLLAMRNSRHFPLQYHPLVSSETQDTDRRLVHG